MVKFAKIGICVYLLWILYIIFGSQAYSASGQYEPSTDEPERLTSIQSLGGKNPLPKNWATEFHGPKYYHDKLAKRTNKLIALPVGALKASEKADRLAARDSVAPVDAALYMLTAKSTGAHSSANQKIRGQRTGVGGVPIRASYRGSGSSSHK